MLEILFKASEKMWIKKLIKKRVLYSCITQMKVLMNLKRWEESQL